MTECSATLMSESGQKRTSSALSIYVRYCGLSRHPMSAFKGRCHAPPMSPLLGEERTRFGSLGGLAGAEDLGTWYGCTHYV